MADLGKKPREMMPDDWLRVHMLHRLSEVHERFMLHPRILDVLEALIGPDVLALQTMLFFKQPGQPGQGFHQDAYYIPSFPDTLCGAWLALSRADEENGCLWFSVGSQNEPIYPDSRGVGRAIQSNLGNMGIIDNASHTNEAVNGLTRVAKKYAAREVSVPAEPGDVVFFGGHIIQAILNLPVAGTEAQLRETRQWQDSFCLRDGLLYYTGMNKHGRAHKYQRWPAIYIPQGPARVKLMQGYHDVLHRGEWRLFHTL